MVWSIFKDSSLPYEKWEECHVAWYKDVDAKNSCDHIRFLHDGYHEVYFDENMITCRVVDGRWAPETHRDILDMVEKTYWGLYVEGFERRNGKMHVLMGS